MPSVETYHSHPRLLDRSHWAVRPMPGAWVGPGPPGRPGLMSPWASKPRGPLALGNVANQGCTLALVPPHPPLSPRTVIAKRRLMVANCAARGSDTMMRDWQTIFRMPAVTDATPDIPFRGNGGVVSSMPGSRGPQDTGCPPPSPLSRDHGGDGSSFQRMCGTSREDQNAPRCSEVPLSLGGPDWFVSKYKCPDGEGRRRQTHVVPEEDADPQSCRVGVNLLSAVVPEERAQCLRGHVCLLLQVATGEGQLAVPMERRRGPNKRWWEKRNQLNLR
ncbi:unnamed protein product [Pleuronectes platessa]|uniref:Uncharacterized protein n=1 Tax=Pleuronectes platessa TaxID=8262 RepID=A0A9N7UX82_PLEPL|nr:unnamed protein product [Pleuronectes platessa]